MKIEVHIERLVLEGLPVTAAEGPRVRAALAAELGRMLAAGGLAPQLRGGGAVPRVAAPHVNLGARERPDTIGRHIARSVHAAIGRGER